MVAEIALALILLSSAGLFFKSLLSMGQADPGFLTEHLVSVPLPLAGGYDATSRQQFTSAVTTRLRDLPGTQSVAVSLTVPFEYVGSSQCCMSNDISGGPGSLDVDPLPRVMVHPVTPDYFKTLGAPITSGREFDATDEAGDGHVAVLNEPIAEYFFGAEDPIGRSLEVAGRGTFTVIGVVRGVRHWGVPRGVSAGIYIPWGRWGSFSDIYKLLVRSTADLETLAPAIREAIWAADPDLPVEEIIPMRRRVEASVAGHRFLSILLGTFATLALVLATGGIYASMLYTVGQRRQELGIRLALGAGGGKVGGMVLRSALGLAAIGVALGLAGSIGVSAVLRSWLYGVDMVDKATLSGVMAILGSAALLASLIPAIKAARTDPQETLKAD